MLDISGTPRRSFFERLSLFAADEEEREKLEELASPEGADLLYEYATREKRSYVEVLGDFPSCKVSRGGFFCSFWRTRVPLVPGSHD